MSLFSLFCFKIKEFFDKIRWRWYYAW
jgi:hypothetical protein